MDEKNLVVCDRELRYAVGLDQNISLRTELALKVFVCTGIDSAMRLRQKHDVHILIADEGFTYEERKSLGAGQTYVLTKEFCRDLGEEEKAIRKYQSADRILAEIFEPYCKIKENSLLHRLDKHERRLIAVYSPVHRIGKTTFAIELGKELARNERTLYLNLEEYADVDGRFLRAEGMNLGDLLYFMRQEEDGDRALRLTTMVAHLGDLEYIPPILLGTDLRAVAPEEWKSLFSFILDETVYENVILDLGESIQGLPDILQACQKVYMPVLADPVSRQKVSLFEEMLRQTGYGGQEEKIFRFAAAQDMSACAKNMVQEGL